MTQLRIKGLKIYQSRGKVYAYHRPTGIRLKCPLGTPEFFAELASIQAQAATANEKSERPGTWGGLLTAYKASPRFQNELKPRTRKDYNRVFDWLAGLTAMPLHEFTREFVHNLRDKAHIEKKRRFANYVLAVVSVVFSFGIDRGLAYVNPVSGIKKIRRPKDMPRANRVWTDEEWKAVTDAAPKHLLAPILLCGVLGWREGEAVSAPRTAYNEATGELVRVSAKSGRVVPTPTPRTIVTAVEAIFPHNATTLLVSSTGRPWTQNGFRSSFFQLIRKLEKKGQVEPGLTCHGLRHTAATRLREGGFHLQTIADFLGQDTQGMAAHYSRDADLKGEMRKVVEFIDLENGPGSKVSNKRKNSV